MARAALRAEDVEAFRERTVRAATRLFAEQGFAAVTLRAIAQELGVSPMAPYRYFENKAEIFAMVRRAAYRRFADAQEAAFQKAESSMERLVGMRDAYVRFALEDPEAYRVMFELRQEPEERYPALAEESHRAFECLERAVTLAVEDGVLGGEPRTVAHLLWASLHGMVTLHLAGKLTLGRSLEELLSSPPIRMLALEG